MPITSKPTPEPTSSERPTPGPGPKPGPGPEPGPGPKPGPGPGPKPGPGPGPEPGPTPEDNSLPDCNVCPDGNDDNKKEKGKYKHKQCDFRLVYNRPFGKNKKPKALPCHKIDVDGKNPDGYGVKCEDAVGKDGIVCEPTEDGKCMSSWDKAVKENKTDEWKKRKGKNGIDGVSQMDCRACKFDGREPDDGSKPAYPIKMPDKLCHGKETPKPGTPTANPGTPTANPGIPTANPGTPTANPGPGPGPLKNDDMSLKVNDNNLMMPRYMIGTWLGNKDNGQTGTDYPLIILPQWLLYCHQWKIPIGIDTAAEYRTQGQIGNILKAFKNKNNDFKLTDVFITTKVPSTKSSKGGKGALGDFALENPIAYAINYILYNLIELGWLSTTVVKKKGDFNWDEIAKYENNTATINPSLINSLQDIAKQINRADPSKTLKQSIDQSIDCILLHHQPNNSDNCKGIFLGFVLAMHCNLIQTYGISNLKDASVINDIQNKGQFIDITNKSKSLDELNNKLKNTSIVIQQQNPKKDTNIANNFKNLNIVAVQNVMTKCHDKDCTKDLTDNKNILVIGGSSIPTQSQKYVEDDLTLFYNIKNNEPPSDIKINKKDNVWYYSDNKCESISKDLVYLNENSYFDNEENCNKGKDPNNKCIFNLNNSNTCKDKQMCWDIDNINKSNFGDNGMCINGNIKGIDITPYYNTRANTPQKKEDFNNLVLYNKDNLDDNYWKNLGFFKNPSKMII